MLRNWGRMGALLLGTLPLAACHDLGTEALMNRDSLDGTPDRVPGYVVKKIKGTWDNTESPPSPSPPAGCAVHITTSQVGRATQIGPFTGTGSTCGNPLGPPTDSPPFWTHDPAPPYFVADFTNQMVWTAANGDELWLRPNHGVFVQSLSNGAVSVQGRLTIAGGTGRFEGGTGWMDVTGGRASGEPGDHLQYEGELQLPTGPQG